MREHIAQIDGLLARYGAGDLRAIDELVASAFYTYVPAAGEPTATDTFRGLATDLKVAAPDLSVGLADLRAAAGDVLEGTASLEGTWTGPLWGAPPTGRSYRFEIPVRIRPVDDRFAFEAQLETPAAIAILRELGLVNPPDEMHLPTPHPVVIDELLLKVLFTGQVADKPCSHLADIRVTDTEATACADCPADAIWPALRLCLTCGHVGCCDTALDKHAKAHWESTAHPLIRSIRLDEGWIWCYEDNAFFGKRTLERAAGRPSEDA